MKGMLYRLTQTVAAHVIRHQATKQFRAVLGLSARIRWCLTGTPIQNRLEDVGSLIRFLHVSPLDNRSTFRRHIIEPLKMGNEKCLQNLRLLLDSICLRRTQDPLTLPNATCEDRMLDLSSTEEQHYAISRQESM